MSKTTEMELAEALSEGLDLCARARKLDDLAEADLTDGNSQMTRSLTPVLWVMEQYDEDLAAWEQKSRDLLTRMGVGLGVTILSLTSETEGGDER